MSTEPLYERKQSCSINFSESMRGGVTLAAIFP